MRSNFSYEERLKECGLTTLKGLRGDQGVFLILNGYENINISIFSLK